LMLFLMCKY